MKGTSYMKKKKRTIITIRFWIWNGYLYLSNANPHKNGTREHKQQEKILFHYQALESKWVLITILLSSLVTLHWWSGCKSEVKGSASEQFSEQFYPWTINKLLGRISQPIETYLNLVPYMGTAWMRKGSWVRFWLILFLVLLNNAAPTFWEANILLWTTPKKASLRRPWNLLPKHGPFPDLKLFV